MKNNEALENSVAESNDSQLENSKQAIRNLHMKYDFFALNKYDRLRAKGVTLCNQEDPRIVSVVKKLSSGYPLDLTTEFGIAEVEKLQTHPLLSDDEVLACGNNGHDLAKFLKLKITDAARWEIMEKDVHPLNARRELSRSEINEVLND